MALAAKTNVVERTNGAVLDSIYVAAVPALILGMTAFIAVSLLTRQKE